MASVPIGGWHAVAAALIAGRAVDRVLLRAGRDDARALELSERAEERGVPVERVSGEELDTLLPDIDHQGAIAFAAPAGPLGEDTLDELLTASPDPLVLALDRVQDPHNLGACLRSAAAAGAAAAIVPKDRAVGLTPAARKVAAGGAELVPLVRVTNLARTLKRLQSVHGFWAVGTAADAPATLHDVDLTGPLVLVLGGEGAGLRRLTRETCDILAAIPTTGAVASLNVSVAAGICLFEARRQRRVS